MPVRPARALFDAPTRLAYVGILFVILALLLLTLALGRVAIGGFSSMEQDFAADESERVSSELAAVVDGVRRNAVDYGAWTDLYSFVGQEDDAWADANLVPETVDGLDLDAVVLMSADGRERLRVVSPDASASTADIALGILGETAFAIGGAVMAGMGEHAGELYVVAAAPIVHTDRSGPPAGSIVMVRCLDDARLHDFATRARRAVDVSAVVGVEASSIERVGNDLVAGRSVPALTQGDRVRVTVTVPARHSAHARRTIGQLLGALVMGALIFALIARRMRLRLVESATSHRASEDVRRAIVDAASDAIGLVELDSLKVIDANPAFAAVLGEGGSSALVELSGTRPIMNLFRRVREHGEARAEIRVLDPDGRARELDVVAVAVEGTGRLAASVVARDVTDRREAEERKRYFAYHDALTGLPNRVRFQEEVERAMAERTGMVGLLFLDLDEFKQLNDRFGHDAADQILLEVARRIALAVRRDDVVARQGGDEFLVLVPRLESREELVEVAGRIRAAIREPIGAGHDEIELDASIGGCVAPDDGTDTPTLVRNADIAMYQAKEKARGGFRAYDPEMHRRFTHLAAVRSGLSRALTHREFVLQYQPQVLVTTGKIVGVEALVRWQQPGKGMVPPADFIAEAEASGLIVEIGAWVLREACRQAAAWCDEGFDDVRMAVNVSPRQLAAAGFLETVTDALARSGLPPELLELEITESAAMADPDRACALLHELRRLGVAVALDDFGTGHSSLSMLEKMPFDRLKIDRSFLAEGPGDHKITRAILALGRSLRMEIVAEGVENEQQLAFLRTQKCTIAQGYGFARPQGADAVRGLLLAGGVLSLAPAGRKTA